MSTNKGNLTVQALEEAADWLQRLQESPCDEKLLGEWLKWCSAAPGNLEAFERVQATWGAFDLPEVIATANRLRAQHEAEALGQRPGSHLWVRFARAASVLVAIGLVAFAGTHAWRASFGTPQQVLTTDVAEQGSQILADGSRVDLGAKTRIVTRFTDAERFILVESGEALFDVVKDPQRPFIVQAGAVRVTAVGTAFTVRRSTDRTVVAVSEGVVRVAPQVSEERTFDSGSSSTHQVQLRAGEQAAFTASTHSFNIVPVDPQVAIARVDGALSFVDEPLSTVVADVNRYAPFSIVITDPALAQRVFTGTVYQDRIDDWLLALEEVFPVSVVRDGATVELTARERR